MNIFLVFLGAGIGGVLRYGVNVGSARYLPGAAFPWGTFAVNVVGSLVMGLMVGWLAFRAEASWSMQAKLFLATGLMGGFTTFSAFSLDAILLWERGDWQISLLYIGASVLLSIAALFAGLAWIRSMV